MNDYENTSEDPLIRKRFSDNILDILRPLSESEMPKLACGSFGTQQHDNGSEYSALSEPFSDLDESYILLDQRKKKPGDDEGDEILLNQFTPEFRKVYDEMMAEKRDGVEEEEPPFILDEGERDSTEDELMLQHEPGQFSPKFREYIDDLLNKCDLSYHVQEKKRKEAQKKKERRPRRAASEESFAGPDNDSLSGVWRMLDAVSVENGFPMSNNYYNLYDDRRFDWLTRDEVPWNQIEESKNKCENWLKSAQTRKQSKP